MVRVFVGILLPGNLKSLVVGVQKNLETLPIECKFIEPENLHISLDFIGEVNEVDLEKIKNKISDLVKTVAAFEIKISGLKLIPSDRFVRVIALEVNSSELYALGKNLRYLVGGDTKPPHLTLCRVKKILSKEELLKKFEPLRYEKIGSFKVSSIQLIKSELRREGPAYSVVSDFLFS